MRKIQILWVDDEIDLLKVHILFLEEKGYLVKTAHSGTDAIEVLKKQAFDIIFLDENMPGMTGLDTLNIIKTIHPNVPVVMITKNEEENIMDEAIGSKINDYLIKPVNPKQILLAIKKNVDTERLVSQKTTSAYQTEFGKLGVLINNASTFTDWVDVYKKLVFWELELAASNDHAMDEVLKLQKSEANSTFAKYIKANYIGWFNEKSANRPMLSPVIFKQKVFPLLEKGEKVIFLLIDNMRYDQWKIIESEISNMYQTENEEVFCSILPTATHYARNAMFAGLMPSEIEKLYPEMWLNDIDEGGKNLREEELLKKQLIRFGKEPKFSFEKVMNSRGGKKVVDSISHYLENQLTVVVYNFVDILSHARTEMDMIKELTNDDSAYRSLTLSWFRHSALLEFLTDLSAKKIKIIITADHGTIRVNNPVKVVGDKETTTNLRYKQGRNLNYNAKEVFEITNPAKAYLPTSNLSSTYIFARNDDFFAYPNNYHYYVNYYKNTYQHGGVSLEEMLIPVAMLSPK